MPTRRSDLSCASLLVLGLAIASPGCRDDGGPGDASDTEGTGGTGASETTTTTAGSSSSTMGIGSDESSESSTGGEPVEPLQWITQCMASGVDLSTIHPDIECAGIEVPLDWDDPEGETIIVAVERVRADPSIRRGQFWLLDGGPGGSGLGYFFDTNLIEGLLAGGWDVVVPNHRGTISPPLTCAASSVTVQCRQQLTANWGDGLRHFNTVQAAADVGELITRMQVDEPGGDSIVYGLSYGTFWASHVLQSFGDRISGVILDSVLPYGVDVVEQEDIVNERAVELLQQCVDDPQCGPTVGFASGEAFAQAVVQAIDADECGSGDTGAWSETNFRLSFGRLINSRVIRNYVPVLAALLQRCTPETSAIVTAALPNLYAAVPPPQGSSPTAYMPMQRVHTAVAHGVPFELLFSEPTFAVVASTMLVSDGADTATPVATAAENFAVVGILESVDEVHTIYGDLANPAWSTAPPPATPVLILNGRYDLQTPLPWAQREADRIGTSVAVFQDAIHGVVLTGNGGQFPDGMPCATQIMLDFAGSPARVPDASCVPDLRPIDVNLSLPEVQAINLAAFGVDDPWSLLPPT